jgi:hypothetical protein
MEAKSVKAKNAQTGPTFKISYFIFYGIDSISVSNIFFILYIFWDRCCKNFTPFFLCLYDVFSQHLSRLDSNHRHLSDIDCLMARTACLVCFISTVNGRSKKQQGKCLGRCGASSGHTTKT